MNKMLLPTLILGLLYGQNADAKPTHFFGENGGIVLAQSYQTGLDFSRYLISEKFDGIRAIWTGSQLETRTGKKIIAPTWFTEALPKEVILDGELWRGRGGFQAVLSTILDQTPNEEDWRKIQYMVFDAPQIQGRFMNRHEYLIDNIKSNTYLKIVKQHHFDNKESVNSFYENILEKKGEGIMYRLMDEDYQGGRSLHLLKRKAHQDDEAKVIGYTAGKGKFKNSIGALIVKNQAGRVFKIGSGLTTKERENPPEIGAQITYRYNGYTDRGIPKFARYIAVRQAY